jgi:choline dehydrogenase-like flavoprotein
MILDLDSVETDSITAEIAIIGAGAVGIVLAITLARRGMDVVLCESGGKGLEVAAQALNKAIVSGRFHAGIIEGRARALGGTTTLWGGQLIEFREIDFEEREWLGLERWPISRNDLEKYYAAASKLLGVPVGDDDSGIWNSLGIPRPDIGGDFSIILTRWMRETNFAHLFKADLAKLSNLRTLLHGNAVGFDFDGSTRRIAAVRLQSPSGRRVQLKADTAIVACGTIEASRLMLSVARDEPAVPWSNNEWVGSAFQDHLALCAARVTPIDKKRFDNAFDNIYVGGIKYNPKITFNREIQRENKLTNIAAGFIFESSLVEHISNVKIFVRALKNGAMPPNVLSVPKHLSAMLGVWWPLVIRYLRDHRAFNPTDLGIQLNIHCEQVPLRKSHLRLAQGPVDAFGMPLVDLHWQVDGREIETIAQFAERLAERLLELGLARLDIAPRLAARDPTILDACTDTNHHCGGLRMSIDRNKGVVDPNLRVHGMENLYVTGAATFPSSSFANPTFTAIALTLKLADYLAEHHNGPN